MRRILFLASSMIISFASFLHAQELSNITAAFVDPGIGARAQALGGAYTAIANGAGAVFWNPAGLAANEGKSVEFSHLNQFSLLAYNAFAGTFNLHQTHAFGLGVVTNGDQQMRETTALLSYAVNGEDLLPGVLRNLKIGASLKYHTTGFGQNGFDPDAYSLFTSEEIADAQNVFVSGDASGIGLDLGFIYAHNNKLHFGLSWQNLVSALSWNNGQESYSERIPQGLALGMAYLAYPGFLLSMDYDNSLSTDRANQLKFGAERVFLRHFALRGGVGQALAANTDRSYTMGLGLAHNLANFANVNLDYAYHIHPLADSHRFSVGLRF